MTVQQGAWFSARSPTGAIFFAFSAIMSIGNIFVCFQEDFDPRQRNNATCPRRLLFSMRRSFPHWVYVTAPMPNRDIGLSGPLKKLQR
jgi:hypothetical protein